MGCAGSTAKDGNSDRAAAVGLSVDAAPRPASDFKVCSPREGPIECTKSIPQIIMAGDLAVGKSCIVKRFTSERFDPALPPTIGALPTGVSHPGAAQAATFARRWSLHLQGGHH